MRKLILAAILAVVSPVSGFAQDAASARANAAAQVNATPALPRFDFDFPGGSVREFVYALNEPLGGTLNVIIPVGAEDVAVPAMKLKEVNVAQVFQALQQAASGKLQVRLSGKTISEYPSNVTFNTPAPITPNSVWSLNVYRPIDRTDEITYRFYQLGPYLDTLKIEDITTAIQTGFKMLGAGEGPTLKFHPETKLLIAVGKERDFQLIDDVLKELAKSTAKPVRLSEVLVNGQVNKPGNIALPKDQKLTIIDAIGRAGGLTADANPTRIRFSRPGQEERVISFDELKKENDPGKMIYLEAGDVIDVARKL